jgi:hypothetical protein
MSDLYEEEFVYIDRCAFVVRPTWKFAAWLNQLDSDPVEDENQIFIQTVYLVDFNERLDARTTTDLLEAYYLDIATSEFGSWWTDEQDWPPIRSLNDFFEYFECAPTETVIDLAADDDYEEPGDEDQF